MRTIMSSTLQFSYQASEIKGGCHFSINMLAHLKLFSLCLCAPLEPNHCPPHSSISAPLADSEKVPHPGDLFDDAVCMLVETSIYVIKMPIAFCAGRLPSLLRLVRAHGKAHRVQRWGEQYVCAHGFLAVVGASMLVAAALLCILSCLVLLSDEALAWIGPIWCVFCGGSDC